MFAGLADYRFGALDDDWFGPEDRKRTGGFSGWVCSYECCVIAFRDSLGKRIWLAA